MYLLPPINQLWPQKGLQIKGNITIREVELWAPVKFKEVASIEQSRTIRHMQLQRGLKQMTWWSSGSQCFNYQLNKPVISTSMFYMRENGFVKSRVPSQDSIPQYERYSHHRLCTITKQENSQPYYIDIGKADK